jgi:hypothetical protein
MSNAVRFNEENLAAIDAALTSLEAHCDILVALDVQGRRRLFKMGSKSEAFCRQALTIMDQNRRVVPLSLELDEALADLATIDQLRPRLKRVRRLAERMVDSQIVLGADVAEAARKGYTLLRMTGKNQGLEALRGELAQRFSRRPRPTPEGDEEQAA